MAPRRSLADKYAQSRRDLFSETKPLSQDWPRDPLPRAETNASSFSSLRSTYPRKSLGEKYESYQRRQKLTNPRFDHGSQSNDAFSYRNQKNPFNESITKPHVGNARVAKPTNKNPRGLMGRVKNFLNNFRLDSLDWESSGYKPLEKSISSLGEPSKDIFRAVPTTASAPETVDYDKIFELRDSKRQLEIDEVTQTIEQRRIREQEAKLERLKDAMQQKLESELTKRREAELDYERKLYLLKTDFEARIFSLEERMEAMKNEADEHSKVLRAQSTAELMEQKEAMYMNQIEASTKIRNLNNLIAEKEKEMQQMREKLDELSRAVPKPGADQQDNDQMIRSILEGAPAKHASEREKDPGIQQEKTYLEKEAEQNEMVVIHFYEALQRSPDTVEDKGRLHMLGSWSLSKRVEHLLQALDAKAEPHKMTSQLDDYERYFDSCRAIKDKDPRHLRQLYQKQSLDGIENYFLQVQELTKEKLRQSKSRMRHLDVRIKSHSLKNLTLKKAEKMASDLESKTRLLVESKQNVALLVRLGEMMQKMCEVRLILQSGEK